MPTAARCCATASARCRAITVSPSTSIRRWPTPDPKLELPDRSGARIAPEPAATPCSAPRLARPASVFGAAALATAGAAGYVIVRDATCRLFGYHGLTGPDGAFCLDHMFGF